MLKHFAVVAVLVFSGSAFADDYVDGYVKDDGTYVAPHYRTERNSTRNDNYSTDGNVNPYTGKKGTKARDNDYDYSPPSYDPPKPRKSKK